MLDILIMWAGASSPFGTSTWAGQRSFLCSCCVRLLVNREQSNAKSSVFHLSALGLSVICINCFMGVLNTSS